jgi:hypothetical protein
MSTALAIAGVTAVLRDLLNDGFVNNDVSGIVGGNVEVSALAPDRVLTDGGLDQPRLNIYMYLATPNIGWRNEDLPSRNSSGQRIKNPPLPLNLHYLLTAYGVEDLQAEILMGYAMQLLHENPVLGRGAINRALNPPPEVGEGLPPALQALSDSGLADQVEQIKIVPEYLNTEEMSKLWTAVQSSYRPTAGYQATVVLIEAEQPTINPLPVLTRGERLPDGTEEGIKAQPSLIPPVPAIAAIEPENEQLSARLGEIITIRGHHLSGSNIEVRFTNARLPAPMTVAPQDGATDTEMTVQLPDQPEDWVAGFYTVTVLVERPGETFPRSTNVLSLALAPSMTLPPDSVARDASTGDVTITLTCTPQIRPNQTVALILGQHESPAQPHEAQTAEVSFVFEGLDGGTYLARLRVDGVDSVFIDRAVTPPQFDATQEITVPA